jgi:hypothetical protein
MFQTLDVMISLAVVFLILSMTLKFFMSMIKRGLKTKAKVVSEEMKTFIGEKTSTYFIPYIENQATYLNFLDVLDKPKKNRSRRQGIRQLSKDQLWEVVTDFRDFLRDNDADKVGRCLKLTEAKEELEREIKKIETHLSQLRKKIENNYDNTLRKIAERYEALMVKYTMIIGVIFAILINADFFEMYGSLSKNSVATGKLVAQTEMIKTRMEKFNSELMKKEGQGLTSSDELMKEVVEKVDRLSSELETAGLNFGWNIHHFERVKSFISKPSANGTGDEGALSKTIGAKTVVAKAGEVNRGEDLLAFFKKVFGLFISGLLISFGAPFWHDFLGAITGVRRLLVGKAEKEGESHTGVSAALSGSSAKGQGLPSGR